MTRAGSRQTATRVGEPDAGAKEHILTLRPDISLEGDVDLAIREIIALTGTRPYPMAGESGGGEGPSGAPKSSHQGGIDRRFLLAAERPALERLIRQATFIDRIESRDRENSGRSWYAELENCCSMRPNGGPVLFHDIHYYKARFFPRLPRALLNIAASTLNKNELRVLDPFVGSGTTLLEASLLGHHSVGIDIDPLSVLISDAKLRVLEIDAADLDSALQRISRAFKSAENTRTKAADLEFPAWLLKNRKMTPTLEGQLQGEIKALKQNVKVAPNELQPILSVLISDAISRRLRFRFMGTGVGRFSLSLSKQTMAKMFLTGLQRLVKASHGWQSFRTTHQLQPASGVVERGDARRLDRKAGSFDLILTSPPYLPSASGRESYVRSRALSLLALGLVSPYELEDLASESLGSDSQTDLDTDDLSRPERELVAWLATDDLRSIKAAPTARYLSEMRAVMAEMHRLLKPDGLALVVSGKQSSFYRYRDREVLYTARSAEYLLSAAQEAGFASTASLDLMLKKANRNARPRSRDAYFETILALRKKAGVVAGFGDYDAG